MQEHSKFLIHHLKIQKTYQTTSKVTHLHKQHICIARASCSCMLYLAESSNAMNLGSYTVRHLQVCTVEIQIKLKWRYILKRAHLKFSILLSLLSPSQGLSVSCGLPCQIHITYCKSCTYFLPDFTLEESH